MANPKVQFSTDDVLKFLSLWREKAKDNKQNRLIVGCQMAHDFIGCSFGLWHLRMFHSLEKDRKDVKLNNYYKKFRLKSKLARAYISNFDFMGRIYNDSVRSFLVSVTDGTEDEWKEVEKPIGRYIESLVSISEFLPALETVEKMVDLNKIQKRYLNRIDISSEMMLYVGNSYFGKSFSTEIHHLDRSFGSFWIKTENILSKENIELVQGKIEDIVVKDDYTNKVIAPLVWNAREHAFNPENNVENRIKKGKDLRKIIFVCGRPEEKINYDKKNLHGYKKPAPSGNFIVTVQDNGFGIREEHIPHIFEKGYSTKKDKTMDHGIGLWSAKEFVEKYGGKISLETKLGEGTTFKFTIPYTHLNDFICVQ